MMKRLLKSHPIYHKVALHVLALSLLIIPLQAAEKIFPESYHPGLSQTISKLLYQYHYEHYLLNDSLSSEIFDRYLENLDFNKFYFLASDIQRFEKYRYELDEDVRNGKLGPAYEIFNVYKQRVEERVDYALKRLQEPFDFTKDEYFQYNRKDAPWPRTREELDELWRKRLKNEALNLKLNGKDWDGIVETLTKRYKNLRKRVNQYKSEDVFQLFMNAVTESYDPHTNYFSPITSDNFRIQMSLSYEGIGARLVSEDDYTKIVEIIPGGPAYFSGELHANDRIVGVAQGEDGEFVDVIGWRLDDVVQLIRGKRGTIVRLQVLPAGADPGDPLKVVVLKRDKIKLEEQAAKKDILEIDHEGKHYKIGIIKIPTFYSDIMAQERGDRDYKSTAKDVRRLLKELEAQQVDGIVIDLRRNGGGSLQEAIEVTGLFIKRGPVVQVRHSNGRVNYGRDPDPGIVYEGPLAVLVDRYSASASEIFAAAIQDYGRGIVVGTQTFGKGTVQNLIPLNRFFRAGRQKLGQLKITVAKFYRINGGSTQHRGVWPDIQFPSIYQYMEIGESARPNALAWDQIKPVKYEKYADLTDIIPKLRVRHRIRANDNPEFKFLREDIEEYRKNKNRKVVSLNEQKRREEREKAKQKRLQRENARRLAKGLPPLKGDENDDNKAEKDKKEKEEKSDYQLEETAHILADYIIFSTHSLTGSIH